MEMSRCRVITLAFAVVLAFSTCSIAQTVTNGLVGYWPMDNTQLTEVTDHTSTTNHGSFLQGSPSWVAGKFGNALDVYLTTDDYAAIPHHASYNANEAYSLALWLYPISCYRKDIFEKGNIQLNHINAGLYVILSKFGEPGPPSLCETSVNRTISEWHHFVFVYDPTAGAAAKKLYVDGVVEFSTNTVGAATDTALNSEPIEFSATPDRRCSARFDDVAMWDRALTSNEVAYLYNGGAGNIVSDLNTPPTAPTNLSAFASDESVVLSWASNSVAPDAYQYNVYQALASPGTYTHLIASNLTATSCTDTGLVNGTTYYYVVRTVDLRGAESTDSEYATATPVGDVTPPATPSGFNAESGYTRAYLTWTANSEPDLAGYNIYVSSSGGGPFVITQALISATSWVASDLSNGVGVYYRLTAEDITGNESSPTATQLVTPDEFQDTNPGMVGYWPFDESSGTNLIDHTDYSNHGYFTGSPTWTSGRLGNALSLSSVDLETDSAMIPHHASYTNTTAYSVAFWFISFNGYRVQGQFSKGSVYISAQNSNARWDNFGSAPWDLTDMGFDYGDANWHHLVATFDASADYGKKLYIDGALLASNAVLAGVLDTALNADPIVFSAPVSGTYTCSNRFDDVAVWNLALSVDQIESLWNEGAGRPAYTPPPAGTVLIVR